MKVIFSIVIVTSCVSCLNCVSNRNQISSRLNFFDVELLRSAAEDIKGNVMVSPTSIKSTLAMILQGSSGQTAIEIQRALRLSPDKEDWQNQFYMYLNALQANSTKTALQNANGIFVSKRLKLRSRYDDIVRRDFASEVTTLDFNDRKSAALAINGWVSQKTHGFIPFVVEPDQIAPATDIVLANALFFKSSWHNSFDPKRTQSGCFYKGNSCLNVAMMELDTELNYAYIDELRAHSVELPYEDKRYSMIIIVPIDRDGYLDLIHDLPYVSLNHITGLMQPNDVQLMMPKFTVNYNENLIGVLEKLRIFTLFSPQANLSGIFEGTSSYVTSFYHKVFMSVDEVGTVAAAASASMVVPLMNNGVEVRVDKPFVFYIRDNSNGIVLFEGKIEEPTLFEGPVGNHGQESVIDVRRGPGLNTGLIPTTKPKQTNNLLNGFKRIFG